MTLGDLGALRFAKGDAAEAETCYLLALSVKERVLGREHPELTATLNNLAVLRKSQGRLGEADRLYFRALSLSVQALGPDHPQVTTCQANYSSLMLRTQVEATGSPHSHSHFPDSCSGTQPGTVGSETQWSFWRRAHADVSRPTRRRRASVRHALQRPRFVPRV